jgi:hypothetical protein
VQGVGIAAAAAPGFNSAFYSVAATVIPVLYVALAIAPPDTPPQITE